MNTTPAPFHRSVLVWTLYLLLGLFSFALSMISPAIPFLRAEFRLDYTMAALHLSMFAIGMVISGFFSAAIIARIGLFRGLWGGMVGTLAGAVLLIVAPSPLLTLAAILVASLFGTLTLASVQASLSSLFTTYRSKALIEANVMASLLSITPSLLMIVGAYTFLGWRILTPAFAVALGLTMLMGWKATHRHGSSAEAQVPDAPGRPPVAFWLNLLLIFFGVATEWCVGFWSAEYLTGLPGHSLALAAAGPGVFQAASVGGRLISSRVAGRLSENRILAIAMVLVLVGFPLFWLRADAVTAFLGLALCGMGVSTFYPLSFSLAVDASGKRLRLASSLAPIASGSAIGLAPLLLGRVADSTSLQVALWAIPIGIGLIALLLGARFIIARKTPQIKE